MDLVTWLRLFRFEFMAAAAVGVVIGGIATLAAWGALSSGTVTNFVAAAIIVGGGAVVFYRVREICRRLRP